MSSIGILVGSNRPSGNGIGLSAWVTSLLSAEASLLPTPPSLVHLNPYPTLEPYNDSEIPQAVKNAAQYASPATQTWSADVAGTSCFVIISPQYNWGIPGVLKNAIDHLYWEWRGKNVFLVTYGGHGGAKCAAHLRDVLGGGLKMNVIGGVEITLPDEYIRGTRRIGDGLGDGFVEEYHGAIKAAITELLPSAAE